MPQTLMRYWSTDQLTANSIILLHLFGALLLGMLLGYERSYHGRAAGMRTYALVCVASTLLTVLFGFPGDWYGGQSPTPQLADPSRIIQGIMTGIGFLCAGVIMKEGLTIRGLSTAGSIWITAAIGIALGVGFYGAAICTALIAMVIMSGFRSLELRLPHQTELQLTVVLQRTNAPSLADLKAKISKHNMTLTAWAYHHGTENQPVEYKLTLRTTSAHAAESLSKALAANSDILDFNLSPTRT